MDLSPSLDHRPPPLSSFLREAGSVLAQKVKRLAPARAVATRRGRGEPVMILPGFLASDTSSLLMRRTLEAAGYRAYGWGLGLNLGARPDIIERLERQLARAARRGPVTLIGWSLGGIYAREVAKRHPGQVARVVTLGTPFSGDMRANNAWRLYELINSHKVDSPPIEVSLGDKPPVPTIAFWSRRDGIIAPASARGQPHECDRSIELDCTHMGFMSAPCVLKALLDLMAEQREGGSPS